VSRPRARPRRDADGPEQAARAYIARRAKPSVVPGQVKLTFTFVWLKRRHSLAILLGLLLG
jgi:hypothetical protein